MFTVLRGAALLPKLTRSLMHSRSLWCLSKHYDRSPQLENGDSSNAVMIFSQHPLSAAFSVAAAAAAAAHSRHKHVALIKTHSLRLNCKELI